MRRALMAASAIAMLAGAQAFAQTVGVGPAETVIIEPEQRTVIREYVVKERVAPVTVKERILGWHNTAGRRRTENCSLYVGLEVLEIPIRLFR